MGKLKKINQLYGKFRKKGPVYFARADYIKYYHKCKLQDNLVYIESKHGAEIASNMFYLLKELRSNPKYDKYEVMVSVREEKNSLDTVQLMLDRYEIKNVKLVPVNTKEYFKALATAKYLITDTTFLPWFIKKEGQIYLNTWHGTPLKNMGMKSETDYASLGNVQRNFLMSDYILFPNEHTKNAFTEDYMLDKLARNAKGVLMGYPRNSIFLENSEQRVRDWLVEDEILTTGKEHLYFFMPTWRETHKGQASQTLSVHLQMVYLYQLDSMLQDDEVLFVKLHPLAQNKMDLSYFKHIKPFPAGKGYETYDFLNACECLITDYSSVMFDYAVSHKKIVLFTYDKEDYFQDRGVYFPLDNLPFTQVTSVEDLYSALHTKKSYSEKSFNKTFNTYDNIKAPEQALDILFTGHSEGVADKNIVPLYDVETNGSKRDVIIYPGSLYKNGITTAFLNMLQLIDTDKYNVVIPFTESEVKKYPEVIREFPEGMSYMPIMGKTNMTVPQKVKLALYQAHMLPGFMVNGTFDKVYKDEIERLYPGLRFDTVINFVGYELRKMHMYGRMPGKKVIYVHNDMVQEMKTRNAVHKPTLKWSYHNYDRIAMVNEDLEKPTKKFMRREDYKKLVTVPNPIPYKETLAKGDLPLTLDKETECRLELPELEDFLNKEGKTFISIGRFSGEKCHKRLIDAFVKLQKDNPTIKLIIVGGRGELYKETLEYAASQECADNILIIKAMRNPQPLLRKCDCFVLSSDYEGQPMVIAEADTQGLSIVCTDCCGEHNYVVANGGHVYEKSVDGVYQGMKDYLDGKIEHLGIDYEAYNKSAKDELYKLLNGDF